MKSFRKRHDQHLARIVSVKTKFVNVYRVKRKLTTERQQVFRAKTASFSTYIGQMEDALKAEEKSLQEGVCKALERVETLRRSAFETFDGPTVMVFLSCILGWNPFQLLSKDALDYFTHYLHGRVLRFETHSWEEGTQVVIANIIKVFLIRGAFRENVKSKKLAEIKIAFEEFLR